MTCYKKSFTSSSVSSGRTAQRATIVSLQRKSASRTTCYAEAGSTNKNNNNMKYICSV